MVLVILYDHTAVLNQIEITVEKQIFEIYFLFFFVLLRVNKNSKKNETERVWRRRLIYKSTWTLRELLIWVVSLGHFPEREKDICKGQKGYSVFFSDNTALTLIVIDIGT